MKPGFTSKIILQRLEKEKTQKRHRNWMTEKGKQHERLRFHIKKWGKGNDLLPWNALFMSLLRSPSQDEWITEPGWQLPKTVVNVTSTESSTIAVISTRVSIMILKSLKYQGHCLKLYINSYCLTNLRKRGKRWWNSPYLCPLSPLFSHQRN